MTIGKDQGLAFDDRSAFREKSLTLASLQHCLAPFERD